jgi:hypothetical protein
MWIYYTKHILERLSQRWIDKKSVEYVLKNWITSINNEWFNIYEWYINWKYLKVITKTKDKHIILITSYYI